MKDFVEITAKSYDEALEKALSELGCTEDEVRIETLEEATKGFLGIGAHDCKLLVSLKEPAESRAKAFLRGLFEKMEMEIGVEAKFNPVDNQLKVVLTGENMGVLIGRGGETLDALQYLTSLAINKGEGEYVRVMMDTENYRAKREATLERLAQKTADRVIRYRRTVTLEPMNANERRIIHSTLHSSPKVTTYSVGDEPYRKVVVALKKSDYPKTEGSAFDEEV